MIRKMLVIAAAVVMPAASIAGISAVAGSGIASAKGLPITAGSYSCALTGSVTFPKPGLSRPGVVTNKLTETTKAAITPSGDCGTKTIKNNIVTATTLCLGNSSASNPADALACSDPANASNMLKGKNRSYGNASSFLTAGPSLVNNLTTAGIKAVLLGNKVNLHVGSSTQTVGIWDGVSTATSLNPLVPGSFGALECSGAAGFQLTGTTDHAGLTYVLDLCMPTDTGTGSGLFFADLVNDILTGGNVSILTAGIGGTAHLAFTQA